MGPNILPEDGMSGTRGIPRQGFLFKLSPLEILLLRNINHVRKRSGG